MFLLDTNIVSELRPSKINKIDPKVLEYLRSIPLGSSYISSITLMELEIGILLKTRKDKQQGEYLRRWMADYVMPTFEDRVLPFTGEAAIACAQLHIPNPRPDRDAMIAAMALVCNMTLVTRNVKDFKYKSLNIINPWDV